jgi:hypothetical protein
MSQELRSESDFVCRVTCRTQQVNPQPSRVGVLAERNGQPEGLA